MSLMSLRGVGRGVSVRVWGLYDSYSLWFSLNELETCRKARISKEVLMFLHVFGGCKPESIHSFEPSMAKKKHKPCDLSRTACGIIPDSGTTLIAGSEKHIGELFEARSYSTEI